MIKGNFLEQYKYIKNNFNKIISGKLVFKNTKLSNEIIKNRDKKHKLIFLLIIFIPYIFVSFFMFINLPSDYEKDIFVSCAFGLSSIFISLVLFDIYRKTFYKYNPSISQIKEFKKDFNNIKHPFSQLPAFKKAGL